MTADQTSSFRQPAKLRIEDFMLLDRAGSFQSYAKTELIHGTIIVVNAQHRPHARAKTMLLRQMMDALGMLGTELEALAEVTVEMPPDNLPEPDIVVTSDPHGEGFVPLPSVRLLVEVSDSTVRDDLGVKAALYAEKGVPEYWVVDLPAGKLHQLWRAGPGGYSEHRVVPFGEPIEAVTISGLRVSTDGVAGK